MKLCIPISADRGLESPVNPHFGSTPIFFIYDTETKEHRTRENSNQHHGHGMCHPLEALSGEPLNALVVGGIGYNALMKMRAAGIEVYLSEYPTVAETIAALEQGNLRTVDPGAACGGHGHGAHGCGHGQA